MNLERSCGAVVFTKRNGQLLYVLVQENSDRYSFPKGHMEGDETEPETARREILEETGLRPSFLEGFREIVEFSPKEKRNTWKQITYFLAEFGDETPTPQPGEIKQILLLSYEEAMARLHHDDFRRVLTAANTFLTR